MNYCTIQDAWGNKLANSYDKKENETYNLLEHRQKEQTVETFNNNLKNNCNNCINCNNCNNFLIHLKECKNCQLEIEKYNNNNKYSILNYLYKFSNDNKDFIILSFILLFILLFINLINNLTK